VNAIRALIDQDSNRRVRSGIGHMFHHFSHDERIANHEPKNFWVIAAFTFVYDLAMIETYAK
jgi:hypothetical protein